MGKPARPILLLLLLGWLVLPSLQAQPKKKKCVVPTSIDQCPIKGCGGDWRLNTLKNRTDDASHTADWTLAQIVARQQPTAWTDAQKRIALKQQGEGTAVRVTGYLIHFTREHAESCNCGLDTEEGVDYHLNLAPAKSSAKSKSVIVEITPRVRETRAGWDKQKFQKLADTKAYVRVTGRLLFDSGHVSNPMKASRATLWEVHPILEFEVCTDSVTACDGGSGWQSLEQWQ